MGTPAPCPWHAHGHPADALRDAGRSPQADLQAQDRAHRIGQTRPVSVSRFCMEGTLEEKILERAERKLYLDRLVIEQGRLTMAMPSLDQKELLGLIRFGADAVLKTEGASLTDEDIDVLLARGKEKTEAMAAKLRADCQHSLANFSLENGGDPAKLVSETRPGNVLAWTGHGMRTRLAYAQ